MPQDSCQSTNTSVELVECNTLVGDGVDEEIVVWRQGIVGREAEFVDIQARRRRWEGSVWRREDGMRVRLVFGFVRIWGSGMEKAAPVGFEDVHWSCRKDAACDWIGLERSQLMRHEMSGQYERRENYEIRIVYFDLCGVGDFRCIG